MGDTGRKHDAGLFPFAIACGYKNWRYLGKATLPQRRPRGRGYTLWYRAAHKSRTCLKGRGVGLGVESGGRYRRESANGSINFMGALRWFQDCCLVGFECKGCLAWKSRVPTIISPFHQQFPTYGAAFSWVFRAFLIGRRGCSENWRGVRRSISVREIRMARALLIANGEALVIFYSMFSVARKS